MQLHAGPFKLGEFPLIAGILTDRDLPRMDMEALNPVDIIELRIDMFGDSAPDKVRAVFTAVRERFGKPILATVRDVSEGGIHEIADRFALYRTVIPLSELVDVEIRSNELFSQVRRLCSTFGKVLIGSFHNFDTTPPDAALEVVITDAQALGADVVKIAVRANSRDDLLRVLHLTERLKNRRLITIAMGDAGIPSRIFTPLLGSLITYGYINTQSAPGQLSCSELLEIFRKLKLR